MVKKYLRNVPTLLLKTARSGKTEVWKIVVGAVKTAGQHLLQKVSNLFHTSAKTFMFFLLYHRLHRYVGTCCIHLLRLRACANVRGVERDFRFQQSRVDIHEPKRNGHWSSPRIGWGVLMARVSRAFVLVLVQP